MMKKALFLIAALLCAGTLLDAKELKVLMIGNSFSNSVIHGYLPKIVKMSGKHQLKLANAYIGGCTLERHCANIDKEKTDPNFKPYTFHQVDSRDLKPKSTRSNLSDTIKADKWDIITIQQGSVHSPYKEKTQGLAKKLIAHVRALAPQAEIVVHETWAYRADHPWFKGEKAKMTQKQMYEKVMANYNELAESNKFRMIPVGEAVHLFRVKLPVKPVAYTAEDLKKLVKPKTMDLTGGDVVGSMSWGADRKNKKNIVLRIDRIHLNDKGKYLQGCVWYMVLFGAKPEEIKCDFKKPEEKLLRECAAQAVAECKFNAR